LKGKKKEEEPASKYKAKEPANPPKKNQNPDPPQDDPPLKKKHSIDFDAYDSEYYDEEEEDEEIEIVVKSHPEGEQDQKAKQ